MRTHTGRLAIVIGLSLLATPWARAAEDLGARIFKERCEGCHGATGAGDGPAAAALVPPPRNFRSSEFWRGRTDDQNKAIVRRGKPGSMMPPFEGALTDAEIGDVVAHLRRFAPAEPSPKP